MYGNVVFGCKLNSLLTDDLMYICKDIIIVKAKLAMVRVAITSDRHSRQQYITTV